MSDLLTYWAMLGRYMDGNLNRALGDLNDEQWHAVPGGVSNSIAFIAWHYFRTEDNIINWIIRKRKPTLWMDGGWSARLGLPRVVQGTGMPVEEAQALRIGDIAAFMQYVREVRANTDRFLPTWDPADYDTVITLKPVGQMTKLQSLAQQALPHGFAHLGEISHIRAVLGLPGIGL
jgi:uncharacterized damage-inducible protein DinB